MAFTVTARHSGNGGETAAQTLTTDSATESADSLLLVGSAAQNDNDLGPTQDGQTLSGGGLTYTQVAQTDGVAWDGSDRFLMRGAVHSAPIGGSPSAHTITVDHYIVGGGTDEGYYCGVALDVTGHDVADPVAQSATGASSLGAGDTESGTVTLAATPTVDNLVVVFFTAGADGGGGFAAPTIGGQSMTQVWNQDASFTQAGAWYRVIDGSESTDTITCTDLGQSVGQYTAVAVEIAAATGGTAVAQATETDTAQAVGSSKAKVAGQASETDLAQPVASAKTKTLGQATETDTAQNVTASSTIVVQLGQAVETDQAQAITAEGGAELGTSYDVRIDWDNDGDFDGTGENVTPRARTDISIQYGRDQARALSPAQPGQATVELQNTSKDYTPGNTSSPLFGLLEPGRRLRMRATVGGNTYGLYRGNLDGYQLRPGFDDRYVAFTALDALGRFREDEISTELHQGIRTGTAINLILDAVGWPEADRDIDLGATIIPWWWEDGTDAFTALEKVVTSEGPTALATVGADGGFIFRDRHYRLTRTASLTSQATFRGSGAEPHIVEPFGYDLGWRDIINSVTLSVGERSPAGVAEQVWSGDGIYSVADGETLTIRTQPSDPVLNAIVPVEGTDFRLRSGAVSVALSQTSGTAIAILITGVGGPAVLDELQLRAFPVAVRRTVKIEAEDTASIERYGARAPNIDAPWVNVHDALAIAEVTLAHRAERTPTIQARMVSGLNNSERLEQQLTRDLSDRVTVIADSPSVDDDFYIEQIRHLITQAGTSHETVFGCEQAPAQIDSAFTFDVAGRGFDDGKFGKTGLDDPDNIFRFDVAGQGFNDGLLAH